VNVWGTGLARREFLHVDDLASSCLKILQTPKNNYEKIIEPMCSHVNVGYGSDITIAELVSIICKVVNYEGDIDYDTSKPDGAPQKLMDTTRITELGWCPTHNLETGLAQTYEWFLSHVNSVRDK
jgi:nucleoside-diphosphate-sugar epimerase